MHSFEEVFNRSGLSRFLNSPAGRIFRLVDICYISALLGGPLSGAKIREKQKTV